MPGRKKNADAVDSHSDTEWTKMFYDALAKYPVDKNGWKPNNPNLMAVMRYVRARKGDLDAAVEQFVSAETFFREQRVWEMDAPDPLEDLYASTCPHLNAGYGKGGEPLYFERTGAINQTDLLRILHPKDLVWRHVRQQQLFVERAERKSEEQGKPVEKQIIISDLKGLSLWPNSKAFAVFKETIRIDQEYYPERLQAIYFINAPLIFTTIFAAIRGWLDPVTKDKFHVLRGNYQEKLLEKISPENLPEEYGGTMQVGLPELVPLSEKRMAWAKERLSCIETGDTSRGYHASGEGPPTAPPLEAAKAEPRKAVVSPSGRVRSPPWVFVAAGGSLWI
mmetsp:Transcript_31107/g.81514  ORF Transcript_31107/g.81514 Transcript_31107/m.81514 type:complete len:336 (-) Transcript_31107:150-1157(-)